MKEEYQIFPDISRLVWINGPPMSNSDLRGKIVLVYAFQMLCPGCVINAGPQIKRASALYSRDLLTVIGLHTVFEHHEAMGEVPLRAFVHEFGYDFPVAIDSHSGQNPIPDNMAALGLKGTPSILLVDKLGRLRRHFFGALDDLRLGTEIGLLLGEHYDEI